jgi:hypothetical protein
MTPVDLPRAQPCHGMMIITEEKPKKPPAYRLIYDKREGIYRPVKIPQYERPD